jgi:hypothetical protein
LIIRKPKVSDKKDAIKAIILIVAIIGIALGAYAIASSRVPPPTWRGTIIGGVTCDFGETNFNAPQGGIFWTMQVTAIIQTEGDTNWIANNTYEVNWTITITYLNQSMYNGNGFSLDCYNPENPIYDTVLQHTVTYETTVTPQHSGTLSMTFRPESAPMDFKLASSFALKVYYKGNIVTSGSWVQPDQTFNGIPASISVENQPQVANPSPIEPICVIAMIIAVVLIVIGIGVFAYRYTKRRKKSRSFIISSTILMFISLESA